MPEIGEIARLVHYLRKHLLGKTIKTVTAVEDTIIYGKAGTSAAQFKEAVEGKKVVDVGRQGKFFWLILSSPPHPLLHCSMTGWIKFNNDDSAYYKEELKPENEEWPPRFMKFILTTDDDPPIEAAFVDPRRLGRIRLVDCPGDEIRQHPPLNQNGPDPVLDKHILTKKWLMEKIRSKKVPIKPWLLDQQNISGIGNWVADETLFNARIHPEQYTDSFRDEEISRLHMAMMHVCDIAVETLADSDQFPKEWLMKYRWNKGKKQDHLPTGEKIEFLTVRGRTSAIVPSMQRRTGPVYKDLPPTKEERLAAAAAAAAAKAPLGQRKRKKAVDQANAEGETADGEGAPPAKKKTPFQRKKAKRQSPRKARQIRQGKRPPD